MTWPDRHPDDVDLYVQDPAGKLVWYNQRDVGLMMLERDDRGDTNDFALVESKKIPLPIREELVSIRGLMAGEYTVNIHLYHHLATEPVPVSVKVEKLNPVGPGRRLPDDAVSTTPTRRRPRCASRSRKTAGWCSTSDDREVADRYHHVEEDVPQPAAAAPAPEPTAGGNGLRSRRFDPPARAGPPSCDGHHSWAQLTP